MAKIVSDFRMGKETGGQKNETYYTLTYECVIMRSLLYSRILLWYIALLIWWTMKQSGRLKRQPAGKKLNPTPEQDIPEQGRPEQRRPQWTTPRCFKRSTVPKALPFHRSAFSQT